MCLPLPNTEYYVEKDTHHLLPFLSLVNSVTQFATIRVCFDFCVFGPGYSLEQPVKEIFHLILHTELDFTIFRVDIL